ncbi:MAG TPA: zf-HC2 domain-containing protein [Burkholderiales bacterium]|nr:zf-HC2 domain-containing protein [Burkholderiales bacterium]
MSPRELDCEEVLRQLLEYLDRALPEDDLGAIQFHLERCRACFSRAQFERRLKEAVRAAGVQRASARLRLRLTALIERF